MKKFLTMLPALLLLVGILMFPSAAEAYGEPYLNQSSATVTAGNKHTLEVYNTTKKVVWKSSKKKIATVSKKGVITAKKAGSCKITAKVGKTKLACILTVINADAEATELSITGSNGGDFIAGHTSATVRFKLNTPSTAVKVMVSNTADEAVYTKTFAKCKAETEYSFIWDGKTKGGSYAAEGLYFVKVLAGTRQTLSDNIYFYTKNEFDGGDGSEASPYLVSNLTQFEAVAKHNGMHFRQTADLDFNFSTFACLFSYDAPFTGTYDGNNYSIRNIMNNNTEAQNYGIFRAVGTDGCVTNLVADGCTYNGNYRVGIIAGFNWGVISNCTVKNCFASSVKADVGGICGNSGGTIMGCTVSNNIINGQYESTGGISGYSNGVVRDCSSKNDNIHASQNHAGGIIGYNEGTITGCKVTDNKIAASGYYAGGIAGTNKGTISNCEVSDMNNMITGYDCGGIIGCNYGSSLNNVYSGTLSQNGR